VYQYCNSQFADGRSDSTNNVTLPVINDGNAVADVGIAKTGSASVFASSNLVTRFR